MKSITTARSKFKPVPGCVVGVDVCEAALDVAFSSDCAVQSYKNNLAGIKSLLTVIKACKPRIVIMEATGKCEFKFAVALKLAAIPYRILNPNRIRGFAKAQGILEKTDAIDAAIIALYGEKMDVQPTGFLIDQDLVHLKELMNSRLSFIKELNRIKSQLRRMDSQPLKKISCAAIADIEKTVEKVDSQIDALVASRQDLRDRAELLQTVPGVGRITASTILHDCPEIGNLSNREIAKLAGLAPMANESGKGRKERHIVDGRRNLRNALYMASVVASLFNSKIRSLYQRLCTTKSKKVALIACARKLLTYLNSMIKLQKNWSDFLNFA